MSCNCFDELPLSLLAEHCEVEVVQFEPQDRVVVQIRCPHGHIRRHSIAWHTVDFEWFSREMFQRWVAQQRRHTGEPANPKPNAVAA